MASEVQQPSVFAVALAAADRLIDEQRGALRLVDFPRLLATAGAFQQLTAHLECLTADAPESPRVGHPPVPDSTGEMARLPCPACGGCPRCLRPSVEVLRHRLLEQRRVLAALVATTPKEPPSQSPSRHAGPSLLFDHHA